MGTPRARWWAGAGHLPQGTKEGRMACPWARGPPNLSGLAGDYPPESRMRKLELQLNAFWEAEVSVCW